MNILEAIEQRKSIRVFEDKPLTKELVEKVLAHSQRAANFFNTQQVSLVYTIDKEKIEKIAQLCGNQPQVKNAKGFVLIVGDFYRAKAYLESRNVEFEYDTNSQIEAVNFDGGLVAATLNLAAMEYGLGSTVIGGVKKDIKGIKEVFNLPENTYVLAGMTLGYPVGVESVKPRISTKAFIMQDVYNKEVQVQAIKDYEVQLDAWFKNINVQQPLFGDIIVGAFGKKN